MLQQRAAPAGHGGLGAEVVEEGVGLLGGVRGLGEPGQVGAGLAAVGGDGVGGQGAPVRVGLQAGQRRGGVGVRRATRRQDGGAHASSGLRPGTLAAGVALAMPDAYAVPDVFAEAEVKAPRWPASTAARIWLGWCGEEPRGVEKTAAPVSGEPMFGTTPVSGFRGG
ncbi:hypothetical protein ACFQQB_62095 [Nonomuraea rubra]|uniref:hypothetical protein n=1 Tax=Nonomuraea rubra TaxID=46180 RepID=UPI00361B8F36